MRNFIAGVLASLSGAVMIGVIFYFLIMPRLDWSAAQEPGRVEKILAQHALQSWIKRNAPAQANPISPTAESLKSAKAEYQEHCAACHGLDGSAKNRFEAEFYPRVPKLTAVQIQKLSDGEIYFIVANGIRNTAMPAFGKTHSAEDMWKTVLWVRHLARLSPEEKAAIKKQMQGGTEEHEKTMEHGASPQEQQ